jgi:NAD(P)-dependent dehydrogenase (short-subunit alcohol dehydrogenase family)
MQNLKGRTAFVTAGAGGLGLGLAKACLHAGMKVAISYRRTEQLEEAQRELAATGHAVHGVQMDVTDRAAVARAADEIEAALGKVHLLINNAGVSVFGPTDEATYDDYDWIMGVNFGGVVNVLVTFIPRIKAHGEGGHIVNVASLAAFLPGPQAGIYTASKFAVRGLTECLRDNLAPHGIGVSLMAPGLVRSHAYESALRRPTRFSNTVFPAGAAVAEQLGPLFEAGMDPLEAGNLVLEGVRRNDLHILTHPENKDEFRDLCTSVLAAWPKGPVDPRRQAIEEQRRAARRDAQTRPVGVDDLTTK